MTRADMDRIRDQFVAATRIALDADFDMVELHAAHGYLLSSFLTPLHNTRSDEYGGCLDNRLRFPREVFAAMRAAWPADRPMSVRISATDWMGDAGITPDERSEEHTSELQSLMRISYGVFCCKQKNTHTKETSYS